MSCCPAKPSTSLSLLLKIDVTGAKKKKCASKFHPTWCRTLPFVGICPYLTSCTTAWQHAHDANIMIFEGGMFTMFTISVYCVSMLTLAD